MVERNEKDGFLSIENVQIKSLVKEYQTPFYVYSKKKILENISYLKTAIEKNFPKYRIQYPIKANSNPYVLKILKDAGLGADCSSPGEIFLAQITGFPMSLSTYTGNYESPADFAAAVEAGISLNLDDYHRLEEVVALKRPERISFRINPGMGRGGFEGIVTGGTDAKFGIPYGETRQAYQTALDAGIRRFGIHMMTGSNILEPLYFAEITQKLCVIAGEALADLGIQFEFINIGGGLGIPYTGEEKPIDLDQTFRLVREAFHDNVKKYNFGDPELVVEPGRFLVGNAGALVSTVTHVKKSYRRFAGLDAGMNSLLRPSLYKAYHQIVFDGPERGKRQNYYVTGQVCENSDIHPEERKFSELKAGDVAVLLDAGAYGFCMSSNYNNRPRPAEFLVSGSEVQLIRRAERNEDLLRGVPGFEG